MRLVLAALAAGFCAAMKTWGCRPFLGNLPVRSVAFGLAVALVAGCAEVPRETPVAAIAPADPGCTLWAPIRAAAPPQIRLTLIADATGFLDAFNHMDPPSDVAADEIWIAKLKTQEGEIARLWFVAGGCLIGRGAIAWEEAERMMGQGA